MHRSVFEFLEDKDVWDFESLQLDKNRPNMPTALSLYGLSLWLHASLRRRNDDRATFLIYSAVMGARADIEDPLSRSHIFWNMGSALERILSRAKPTDRDFLEGLRTLICAHKDRREGIGHATLCLAVELGAFNFVKAHLEGRKQAQWNEANQTCGCCPLLYHAVKQPLLLSSVRDGIAPAVCSPSKAVISSLLSSTGAIADSTWPVSDLNQQFVCPFQTRWCPDEPSLSPIQTSSDPYPQSFSPIQMSSDPSPQSPSAVLTPWTSWLDREKALADPTDADTSANLADITVMFLVAGADPTRVAPDRILKFLSDQANRDKMTIPQKDIL